MIDFTERSYSVSQSFSQVRKRESHGRTYLTGTITTRVGIMRVYSQGDKEAVHATSIEVVIGGRCHHRHWRRRFTARGIARKANEWAREIEAETLGQAERIGELEGFARAVANAADGDDALEVLPDSHAFVISWTMDDEPEPGEAFITAGMIRRALRQEAEQDG